MSGLLGNDWATCSFGFFNSLWTGSFEVVLRRLFYVDRFFLRWINPMYSLCFRLIRWVLVITLFVGVNNVMSGVLRGGGGIYCSAP